MFDIGHDGRGFAFDNESPRHRVLLDPYRLADRLVTCGEYLKFVQAGGYRTPELWLSDGWATVQARDWQAPLYWHAQGDDWQVFTLGGLRALDPAAPVRLSTTNCWPHSSDMCAASMRAVVSVPAPGVNGEMKRTGLSG